MDAVYEFTNPIFSIRDFQFHYENSTNSSCQIDELDIYPGQFIVLCGPSGSGKSTFLKLVNGLVPEYYPGHFTGQFLLVGSPLGDKTIEELSYQVTSVFQNPATQFFHRKVKHELVFPCENQGKSLNKIQEKLRQVSGEFSLEDLEERDIFSLSGGEKERVALATALMQDTEILVFDEPTANLDRQGIERLQEQLRKLKEQGKTIIIAEHRLDYLNQLADSYLYFKEGHLTEQYASSDFLLMTEEERQKLSLRSLSTASHYQLLKRKTQLSVGGGDLKIQNLELKAGQTLLKKIEKLDLFKGEILGLLGQNGAGKTTLAHYLAGLKDAPDLKISWDNQILSAKERLKKVALIMQEVRFQLFSDSVRKELTLGLKEQLVSDKVVEKLGLTSLLERHPMTLSGGEQQRLVLVASALSQKEIFIFDEPTSGLDYQSMKEVANLLLELKKEGKVLLLISHDEELLSEVCDRIFCLGNE